MGDVDDGDHLAIEVPRHRDHPVVHRAFSDDHGMVVHLGRRHGGEARARHLDHGRFTIDDDHLAASVRRSVGDRSARGGNRCEGIRDDRLESFCDPPVCCFGVVGHPGDRRPGNDVVELLQQHLLPQTFEFRCDLGRCAAGRHPPEFRLAKQTFAATVPDLGGRLGCQRAAVHLEVQLAGPHGYGCPNRCLGLDVFEELIGRADRDGRHAVEVGHPPGTFHHLPRRTATTVAVTERHQRPVAPTVLLEICLGVPDLCRCDLRVVGVDRRKVGQHSRAVETLPPERRMWEHVLLVPTELLRDEPGAPARSKYLRKSRRVPEHIGDPDHRTASTELRLEVPLPEHQLPHDALTARQVHVGLDPHAADRVPLTGSNLGLDAFEQGWLSVLDPLVLRRLRAGEVVVGVVVHQAERRGECACALSLCLAYRPQPRRVDVGMTDGDDSMGTRSGAEIECRLQHATSGWRSRGDVVEVEHVERGLQLTHQTNASGLVRRHRTGQSQQHVDVEQQSEHVVVALAEGGVSQSVQRLLAGRRERAERRWSVAREGRVRGSFDEEGEGPRTDVWQRQTGAPGVDALHRPTVDPHQALGLEPGRIGVEAEVDHRFELRSGHRLRHVDREAEPCGAPGSAPMFTDGERSVVAGHCLVVRDRLARRIPRCNGQRNGVVVQRWKHSFVELAANSGLDELQIVVHDARLVTVAITLTA